MSRVLLTAMVCQALIASAAVAMAEEENVIHITLIADAEGELAELRLDKELVLPSKDGKQTRLEVLQSRVRKRIEHPKKPKKKTEFSAELKCDEKLKYQHVIEVIGAISGYVEGPNKKVVKLIKEIRFITLSSKPKE